MTETPAVAPLRLLFVSAEHAAVLGTGGVGSYVATAAAAMARRGHEVHVLSCREGAAPSDVVHDGVHNHVRPLVRMRGLGRVVRGQLTRSRIVLAVSNVVHARSLGRFDAVEAPDWQAEGLLFALRKRNRLVTHLHTPQSLLMTFNEEPLDRDARWADRLERRAVRRSARITCPSQLLVDELRRRGWLGDREVDIIRYPVDVDRFADVPPPADGSRSVLLVGRVERRKAPERLVDALALLRADGIEAAAAVAGRSSGRRDGQPYGDWLAAYAAEQNVPCHFLGELAWASVPDTYADSRVVCVPSEFESFSMAAVEGMASGRPTVVSASIGAGEVLGADDDAQITDMKPAALADALRPFLTDSSLAREVGERNRQRVAAQCHPERVAAAREEVYAAVARGAEAARPSTIRR